MGAYLNIKPESEGRAPTETLLGLQNAILEMIARGETLEATCVRLCLDVEALLPSVTCSVLTVDVEGRLHPLAGPSLPPAYSASLDGVPIGPYAGSCGTAAYFGTDIAVTDIRSDLRWADHRHHVEPHGLRACWWRPSPFTTASRAGRPRSNATSCGVASTSA
jgi:GAF domain-containing protein